MAIEPRVRLAVAALFLAGLLAGLAWVVGHAPDGSGEVGEFHVVVVGPGGAILHEGLVHSVATPLEALRALAEQAGFSVVVERQPWIGTGCTAEYVRGIDGIEETASGGWNYYVRSPGGPWTWQWAGAACHELGPGEQVEWCWVEDDVCRHHAP
jgi:hypothetical protein